MPVKGMAPLRGGELLHAALQGELRIDALERAAARETGAFEEFFEQKSVVKLK